MISHEHIKVARLVCSSRKTEHLNLQDKETEHTSAFKIKKLDVKPDDPSFRSC